MYEFEYFNCKFVRKKSKISGLAEVESACFFLSPRIANPLMFPYIISPLIRYFFSQSAISGLAISGTHQRKAHLWYIRDVACIVLYYRSSQHHACPCLIFFQQTMFSSYFFRRGENGLLRLRPGKRLATTQARHCIYSFKGRIIDLYRILVQKPDLRVYLIGNVFSSVRNPAIFRYSFVALFPFLHLFINLLKLFHLRSVFSFFLLCVFHISRFCYLFSKFSPR